MSIVNHTKLSKLKLPEKGSEISFKNHNRSMRVPFIVYADFESFTSQLSTCQPNSQKSYTNQYQKLIPSGFCYHIKCLAIHSILYNQLLLWKTLAMMVLHKYLWTHFKSISRTFKKSLNSKKNMIMTRHDELVYDNSTNCHSCNEELGEDWVRDHCHLSGKFRSAAYEDWSLNKRFQRFPQLYFTICLATIVT